jgi:PmbA protein
MENLQQIAADVVASATKGGASAADCVVREGNEMSVNVRQGAVEQLKQAGSKAIGLRVMIGQRSASAYTSDFSSAGLGHMVSRALDAAKVTSEDPVAGLADPALLGKHTADLQLFSEQVPRLEAPELIAAAKLCEEAAYATDPRIRNSDGGSADAYYGRRALATSAGFVGEYQRSYCSLSVSPIAAESASSSLGMQRDYWYSVARNFAALEPAEQVGRIAAQRALRRLGARKVPTTRVPVIFDPRTARSLLSTIGDAISGDSIYRQASYLAGKLGERVASERITIIDDGAMPGGFGSAPFDDEGVKTRRNVVIDRGTLNSYLLNSYAGRKLNMPTTANASRGLAGSPSVGTHNFYLQAGADSPEKIIASVQSGFYVTDFMGFGVNVVTGDISHGASGVWIERGELAYPVEEVTVAGNLLDIFRNIVAVGADLEFRGSMASPTILVSEMAVAGS